MIRRVRIQTRKFTIRLINRKQIQVGIVAFVLLAALAVIPPWRYVDGSFAGFRPIMSPPEALPDSLVTGEIAREYVPIRIIPVNLAEFEHNDDLTREQMRLPYLDIRRMMTVATIIFLGSAAMMVVYDDRVRRRKRGSASANARTPTSP